MTEELIADDSTLLMDRLVRSFHRNRDGHLAASERTHINSVLDSHNVAVIYVYDYFKEDRTYALREHYVYSYLPHTYAEWLLAVVQECKALEQPPKKRLPYKYFGAYGWLTNQLRVTPLRSGDLFIKIDKEGATGVRLAFNPKEDNRDAHSKAKKNSRRKRGSARFR